MKKQYLDTGISGRCVAFIDIDLGEDDIRVFFAQLGEDRGNLDAGTAPELLLVISIF